MAVDQSWVNSHEIPNMRYTPHVHLHIMPHYHYYRTTGTYEMVNCYMGVIPLPDPQICPGVTHWDILSIGPGRRTVALRL